MKISDSRGFAFVTYEVTQDASEAVENLNDTNLEGKKMRVEFAKRSKGHEPTPGRYLGHYKSNYERRSSSPGKRYQYLL